MTAEPRITMDDITAAGHCPSGARAWFRRHDLNFAEFLRDGVPPEDLLATGDGLAEQVVSHARERRRG